MSKKVTTEDFIKKAREIHGNKYDYSKVEYNGTRNKVCIICPIHGEFEQTPYGHITLRQGCPICKQSHLEEEIRILLETNNITYECPSLRTSGFTSNGCMTNPPNIVYPCSDIVRPPGL